MQNMKDLKKKSRTKKYVKNIEKGLGLRKIPSSLYVYIDFGLGKLFFLFYFFVWKCEI